MKVLTTQDVGRVESVQLVSRHDLTTERVAKVSQDPKVGQIWKEGTNSEDVLRRDVEDAVDSINNSIEHINRTLRFSLHEDTQQMIVRVVNIATDEVIKEIPPEDVLDTVARIREMIGLLIDERA